MEARLEALQAEHRALRERSGDAAKRAAELDDEGFPVDALLLGLIAAITWALF